MRKDCAEIIVLGGKKKKVRRSSPLYKKPKPTAGNLTLEELVLIAIYKGGPVSVVHRGYEVRIAIK